MYSQSTISPPSTNSVFLEKRTSVNEIPSESNPMPSEFYETPFTSLYTSTYTPVLHSEKNIINTPKINIPEQAYTYMPRPAYITTPGDFPSFNPSDNQFMYTNTNYQKPVNDKLIETRILNFSSPQKPTTFTPNLSKTTLL